ncbi:hypothetical protein [Microbacterium sp. W4I20]|uniref:hypothetical protein n=1 Tax=Microbacterium sp. W4I20 TaxID=3042262 RepID=UPI002785B150|nr:hypothetical protein [Microbacterium sp. W4I20]MDQ0729205.1 hypothetical protein [Microbacterium sp. W4I20]
MRKPTIRTRRLATFIVGPTAIVIAGLMVWQGSNAAFTATTRNTGSNWETGSVILSDDDLGAAAFRIDGVTPGQTGSKCLVVTSQSTVPGQVRTYVQNLGAQGLENNITISLQRGTGGSFADCTGFVATTTLPPLSLATINTGINNYATGVLPWTTAGIAGEATVYRATWTFDVTSLTQAQIDALQGKSVSVDVVWELQSS